MISEDGVAMDPEKMAAVLQCPRPTSAWALRGFLGLTRYDWRFIRDYGKLARPLTTLLNNYKDAISSFQWTLEADTDFVAFQNALVTEPVLTMPDFSKPFFVECDASGLALVRY